MNCDKQGFKKIEDADQIILDNSDQSKKTKIREILILKKNYKMLKGKSPVLLLMLNLNTLKK